MCVSQRKWPLHSHLLRGRMLLLNAAGGTIRPRMLLNAQQINGNSGCPKETPFGLLSIHQGNLIGAENVSIPAARSIKLTAPAVPRPFLAAGFCTRKDSHTRTANFGPSAESTNFPWNEGNMSILLLLQQD